jgi:hypothetical protein
VQSAVFHEYHFFLTEELKHTFHVPFGLVYGHLVDTYASLCCTKLSHSHMMWMGVSSSSPVSTGHIAKWGVPTLSYYGRLLFGRMETQIGSCRSSHSCVGLVCCINCSLFVTLCHVRSRIPQFGLPEVCCGRHLLVHSSSMLSFSSFLIALMAVSPEPSTEVELPQALASLSASSLPRIPTGP